jgi:hypothetical protein
MSIPNVTACAIAICETLIGRIRKEKLAPVHGEVG